MLIDTKIVKRLNFRFCKTNAIYLLVDYMERNEDIQTMQQRIPILIDFMEWMYAHDYRLLIQDGLNEYISFLYEKNSFKYADLRCCFIKSFCKYLIDEGFCGFVSFSSKPHSNTTSEQESENPSAQNGDSKENEEEQSKKRRGRPRKSESQPEEKSDSCNQNINNNDGEKPKKRRGRPRKSEQQADTEYETDKQSESNTDQAEDQSKKRRGRPRKSEQNHTNDDTANNAESNNSEKKRRGRPPKGSVPKLKRVTNYYDALGVSPDADIEEIKKVYRKMAMEMHPDLHKDDPLAEKRITSLNMIMSVLKDDVERMVYDVAMGFIEYDERMENVTYKEIKWHTKRYYTVWM